MCEEVGRVPEDMTKKIWGDVSVLMSKGYKAMHQADFGKIAQEFQRKFPDLVKILIHIMLKPEQRQDEKCLGELIPKLAMIYGIVMKERNHELSLVQRIISLCLADSVSDQKVKFQLSSQSYLHSHNYFDSRENNFANDD